VGDGIIEDTLKQDLEKECEICMDEFTAGNCDLFAKSILERMMLMCMTVLSQSTYRASGHQNGVPMCLPQTLRRELV
jgi:hypothetical protein